MIVVKPDIGDVLQNFEQGETDELHQYLTRSVLWRPKVVKLKCAEDTYNDETRIKFTVNSIEDTDFVQESQVGSFGLGVLACMKKPYASVLR